MDNGATWWERQATGGSLSDLFLLCALDGESACTILRKSLSASACGLNETADLRRRRSFWSKAKNDTQILPGNCFIAQISLDCWDFFPLSSFVSPNKKL